ncbi:multidrug resistance-associated protein 1 [Halyomorpha halys]|uniref:multidrug resistance-associated protein 1 n=1 Tax=Halyomorpha halys TaxID=286706 RepID=UPI0006D50B40|nr:multidrug resistance-associated protein 1-like [Halyomorpha halys]
MDSGAFVNFCGSPFWVNNLTWNTDSPKFTPCWGKTVPIWIPCAFLWLFSIYDIYSMRSSKKRNIPWNWRNNTKLIITATMIVLNIFDFYKIFKSNDVYPVDIISPIINLVSLVFCSILVVFHRKYGQQSSGLLFLFWFLVIILGPSSFIIDFQDEETKVVRIIYYCLCIAMFLLNCIADLAPLHSDYPPVMKPSPEESSSFLNRITFSWLDTTIYRGFKKPLLADDLWSVRPQDSTAHVFNILGRFLYPICSKNKESAEDQSLKYPRNGFVNDNQENRSSTKKPSSILPVLCKSFGPSYLVGASFKLMRDVLKFTNPQLLMCLIGFAEGNEPYWRGFFYAALLLASNIFQVFLFTQYCYKSDLVGLRIKTALTIAIYRKALKLSSSARKTSTVGEIVNLMAVDAQRFFHILISLSNMWSIPLQIILAVFFIWQILGPSVLAGLAILTIMIPVNGYLANLSKKLQIKQMKYKDERLKIMNEILSGIKVLKLYAWERSFEERVQEIRGKEMKVLKQTAYLKAVTSLTWSCTPFFVSLTTFATYVLIDKNNILNASKAFVSLSLFNILRSPMMLLPDMISSLIQIIVSVKRIDKFLNNEELDPEIVNNDDKEINPLIIENGTFSWTNQEEPTLKNINIRVKEGSLVAVIGDVGSGKSSLISAFLGEMYKLDGRVNVRGSIAYVSQLSWIQNCSLQDNILFGTAMDKKEYDKVIKACALKQDLKIFPNGDQTEIGERGVNLSGGQKQRLSLARAVYSNRDIYLFDDPLSAVDSHVGKHLFEQVISSSGLLRNKTRLFVTHNITYLSEVDEIIVMKEGRISEVGTYHELIHKKGALSEYLATCTLMADHGNCPEDSDHKEIVSDVAHLDRQKSVVSSCSSTSDTISESTEKNTREKQVGEKIIKEETVEVGGVQVKVYGHYFRAIGFGLLSATIILTAIQQGFSMSSNFWLSAWSSDKDMVSNGTTDTSKRDMYLGVYGLLGIAEVVAAFLSYIFWYIGAANAGVRIHILLLSNIFHSPMSFFDTTPQGRILSRFSKDIDVIDDNIPENLQELLMFLSAVIGTLLVISYSTPLFIAVIIPIGVVYYLIQRIYVTTSQQIKRLESVSRSPVYSHFGESVTGSSIIRAYNAQERFIKESEEKIDNNLVCSFPTIAASRWLTTRVQMIGNVIVFFSALVTVINKDSQSPGVVGLTISYALQMTLILDWIVGTAAEVETNIVAIERIKEYSETPQEAAWDSTTSNVSNDWPQEGKVEFIDYKVRYRDGLELVLNGINLVINGGEKIGIVGRTGAGKSSIMLGLFRIIEPAGGKILVDGVDILKLGLQTLRSHLTIIPQDPILFSGSLRMNLDPFGYYSDEQIWRALELTCLNSFVSKLPAGLQHEVTEGGENISVGQRQLICLARALLRKTKILVLDEATGAVDLTTDDFIQKTIRTKFADCTVLTIAHRINTIMDYDRVLVLDEGCILEIDAPTILLENKSSAFYKMAQDAGAV